MDILVCLRTCLSRSETRTIEEHRRKLRFLTVLSRPRFAHHVNPISVKLTIQAVPHSHDHSCSTCHGLRKTPTA